MQRADISIQMRKTSERAPREDLEDFLEDFEELIPPSDIALGLITMFYEWNMHYSASFSDESLQADDEICCDVQSEDGVAFQLFYTYYAFPEDAKKAFDTAVKDGEVYGVVDKKVLKDDSIPHIRVWWGNYQLDDSSPVMQDIYVMVQFEREYLYFLEEAKSRPRESPKSFMN